MTLEAKFMCAPGSDRHPALRDWLRGEIERRRLVSVDVAEVAPELLLNPAEPVGRLVPGR
jgi:hypothetical protein